MHGKLLALVCNLVAKDIRVIPVLCLSSGTWQSPRLHTISFRSSCNPHAVKYRADGISGMDKDNLLLFPSTVQAGQAEEGSARDVQCRERLGGLLKYYEREAA
jgi:hypothetical protein